ncbi:DNA-binding response regulator in two-component regulatory system with PhoR (or CreC) [Candidatus Sulfobium mesophilum]|uniref:Phosphate regulon transcriptional regulatory protein PhoB n=1 Tax=Candidatus Sulfobium mesophilum TaxID=2016548 RepID=A0A2U3QGU0_9BACT|nr:DNA-binding response regulator in two-component regulatory system with PhoR (or CreC) [Candidatus Sulfobium mesophilum]
MTSRRKVLVVDDEADIVELVSYNLNKEGFDVYSAADGQEALAKIRATTFDFVILDLMLPGMSGMEICRVLRNETETKSLPIIMLTAKGEEVDRVLGLEMGADDYVAKPFSPRELVARVKAVLRRTLEQKKEDDKTIRIGELTIDKETYSVTKRGVTLSLSSTEFRLLLYLVERKGKVFNRDQLLDAAWKDEAFVEPRTVDVHVRRLRTQIEDDPANPKYLRTKRGIGYYVDAGA